MQKTKQDQYQTILTEQAWSINNLLYGFWGHFLQDTVVSPKWVILLAQVTNHSVGFGLSCLLMELAI